MAEDRKWQKLVSDTIARADFEWLADIKAKRGIADRTMDTSNFRVSEEHVPFVEVKIEKSEESTSSYQDEGESSDAASMSGYDPLLGDDPTPKRRRKVSGPHTETPEARSMRLARMSAYASKRLANETPEQRATRLKRMSQYAAKRLAQETSEQRAKRLSRMSQYAAKRLSEETPEQRQTRLTRMSAYAAKRHIMKKYATDKAETMITKYNNQS